MAGQSKVTGAPQVVNALRQLADDIEMPAEALDRIGLEGETAAKNRTPRRSGRLARTVRSERAGATTTLTAGGGTVEYAGPINYGWRARNIEPAGFLEAGGRQMEARAVDLLEDHIDAAIKRRGLS